MHKLCLFLGGEENLFKSSLPLFLCSVIKLNWGGWVTITQGVVCPCFKVTPMHRGPRFRPFLSDEGKE